MTCPMLTRATHPYGFPQAPRIPCCNLSAPAHDNILLIRTMWKGWALTLKWKESFPEVLTMYLLQQIRAASKASEEICSYSSETKWAQKGKSSTAALFRPKSKIRILGSGTDVIRLVSAYGQDCHTSRLNINTHHLGCTSTWGKACSYSNGSNEQDDDPF